MLGLPFDISFCNATYSPTMCRYFIGFIIVVVIIFLLHKIITPRVKRL